MAIYLTADLHLNHFSILDFEKYNLQKNLVTPITTLEQYNKMVIAHINEVVMPSDTLYILGDFAFGGYDIIKYYLSQIRGRKILVMGNHDKYTVQAALRLGFDEVYDHPIYLPGTKGKVLLSHYPAKEAYDNPFIVYNFHGHIHGGRLDLPNFVNVNIAMNNYYPVPLKQFMPTIEHSGKNRNEKWLHEWYAEHQIFTHLPERNDVVLDQRGKLLLAETLELNPNRK